jgi:hypothetical protein
LNDGTMELRLQGPNGAEAMAWILPRRFGCDRGHWDCGSYQMEVGSYYFMRLENALRQVELELLRTTFPANEHSHWWMQHLEQWSDRAADPAIADSIAIAEGWLASPAPTRGQLKSRSRP